MTTFEELSNSFADAVESAAQSVVGVAARRKFPATGIVWDDAGHIVTANHVVHDDENITIILPNGETAEASLVGRAPMADIAVLKTEAEGLTPAKWVADDAVRVGQLVLAIGRPGENVQATLGALSGMGQVMTGGRKHRGRGKGRGRHHGRGHHRHGGQRSTQNVLITDVTMYPGFSGGPLIAGDGSVYGLNTSGLGRGASTTIPVSTLQKVTAQLIEHGKIETGWLGIGLQPVKLPDALQTELEQDTGILIVSVEEGSPAQTAGIFMGDTLVGAGGASITNPDDLFMVLTDDVIGKDIELQIIRGGDVMTVNATVGTKPE